MTNDLNRLPESTRKKLKLGKITKGKAEKFGVFLKKIEREFFQHPVIQINPYTQWLREGEITTEQLRDLIRQWGVFSNHFLVVQCKRMVQAKSPEAERGARSILANEIGVGMDIEQGDCDGKTFHAKNAHINWLRELAKLIGMDPMTLGAWENGSEATHAFLKGLEETYGSFDGNIGSGASFAIETWAAFGIGGTPKEEARNFWSEHIEGLKKYNDRERIAKGLKPLPLGFFQYHFKIEGGHGANVFHELEETFFSDEFNETKYMAGGKKALEAIYTFWKGLDATRKKIVS